MFVLLRRAFPACPPVIWVWKVFSQPPSRTRTIRHRPNGSDPMLHIETTEMCRARARARHRPLPRVRFAERAFVRLQRKEKVDRFEGGVEISHCLFFFLWRYNYLMRNFPAQACAYGCEEDARWRSTIKKNTTGQKHTSEYLSSRANSIKALSQRCGAIGSALKPTIRKWEMRDAQVQMTFRGFCATTINSTVTQL